MGGLFDVAKAIGTSIPLKSQEGVELDKSMWRQMVVVCGKNAEVKKKLESFPWSKNSEWPSNLCS